MYRLKLRPYGPNCYSYLLLQLLLIQLFGIPPLYYFITIYHHPHYPINVTLYINAFLIMIQYSVFLVIFFLYHHRRCNYNQYNSPYSRLMPVRFESDPLSLMRDLGSTAGNMTGFMIRRHSNSNRSALSQYVVGNETNWL